MLEANNKFEIQQHLSTFKERGVIQFDKVLKIPMSERIPELVKEPDGEVRVAAVITAVVKSALENINLRYALTEDQLVETAFLIIEQSSEDYLAIEDVMLFLKEMVLGQMGDLFSRIDIPTFFKLFEKYRQERHVKYLRIKEEMNAQNKALPVNDTLIEMFGKGDKQIQRDAMSDYLKNQPENPKKYYPNGKEME